MKTFQPKKKDIERNWHIFDAKGQVLGRMATEIARVLLGKAKPKYAPHLDMGDSVVVINAKDVELTGRKMQNKVYYRHSGYPGGLKEEKISDLMKKNPEKVIERAVSGMLPKNRLHDQRMRRLKVFADDKHPYKDKFKKEK
jgi:large subunit ribosomal protein L13